VVVRRPRALRRLLYAPGELGLAEAYIAGDLDVEGDLAEGLGAVWAAFRAGEVTRPRPGLVTLGRLPGVAGSAIRLGAVGPRPPRPGSPARLRGWRHTRRRDAAAIAHHYDLSNEFYELLLDSSMAYSCGYFTHGPAGSLGEAQHAKLDLVCRKLGLRAGRTLLDIGCGWGSLICHAAANFDVTATGVTLSAEQHRYVSKRVADAGLADRITVRLADYREIDADAEFDAVSSIEMGEHVGAGGYPAFAAQLHRAVRPGGRVLIQQNSRAGVAPDGGPFIRTWIAPDMHMRPLGETIGRLTDAGLEIRDVQALREHYVWTVRHWQTALEDQWTQAVSLVGEQVARVWRLYLAGGALAFAEGRMGVDQILAIRPFRDGSPGMEPTPQW
jgi:cyclopropane-fatty-acyl-phospholipid synthase